MGPAVPPSAHLPARKVLSSFILCTNGVVCLDVPYKTHPCVFVRYPDKSLDDNYCRNPDASPVPWCYTTDPEVERESCEIRKCSKTLHDCSVWLYWFLCPAPCSSLVVSGKTEEAAAKLGWFLWCVETLFNCGSLIKSL